MAEYNNHNEDYTRGSGKFAIGMIGAMILFGVGGIYLPRATKNENMMIANNDAPTLKSSVRTASTQPETQPSELEEMSGG